MKLQPVRVFIFTSLVAIAVADMTSFDCKMKQLGLDFAQNLQPWRAQDSFQELADALNGAPNQGPQCVVAPTSSSAAAAWPPVFEEPTGGSSFYIDAIVGSDSNPGTQSAPLKTIEKVGAFFVVVVRAMRSIVNAGRYDVPAGR
jgi:hypothetical protein